MNPVAAASHISSFRPNAVRATVGDRQLYFLLAFPGDFAATFPVGLLTVFGVFVP